MQNLTPEFLKGWRACMLLVWKTGDVPMQAEWENMDDLAFYHLSNASMANFTAHKNKQNHFSGKL